MFITFSNNQGIGGFEEGGYDQNAKHPTDTNWTRLSNYNVLNEPNLFWKVTNEHSFIENTDTASFVVDSENNALISSSDNTLLGPYYGSLILINSKGKAKQIFRTEMRLNSPVIGKEGYIYITTTGAEDSSGHRLYCLNPDGKIKWEFNLLNVATCKPVLDNEGNVYIYTYSNGKGTFYSINRDGILNWKVSFKSINWYEPVIANNGIIYIGLNVNQKLLAFNKNGTKLWEKKLGQGLGFGSMIIKNDNTIYASLSGKLYAIDINGNVIWEYKPLEGNVATAPALDQEGNLYLNESNFRLVSLTSEGKERWRTTIKGAAIVPPIIGGCNKFYQQSFMQNYPKYVSWIECFSNEGIKIWEYQLEGTVVSTVLADNNLMYILSNCHRYKKRGWDDTMDVKWELHAIGSKGTTD